MLITPALFLAATVVLVGIGWGGKIFLSVLGGGVIGLANLWLWQGLVGGLVQSVSGESAPKLGLLARMLVKFLLLAGMIVVALKTPVDVVGLMAGFGSTLAGLAWQSWTTKDNACCSLKDTDSD